MKEKQTERQTTMFSKRQLEEISKNAEYHNMTISQYIRFKALERGEQYEDRK